jgi:hypothetical protein
MTARHQIGFDSCSPGRGELRMDLGAMGWPLIIAIPEVLRDKLGPEGARALADLLNEASVQTRGDVIEVAANRFERRLAEELAELRAELHSQIGSLRAELHSEVGGLRADMGAFEARITRWMFVFWIGQIGALLGILFAFFRP